MALPTVHQAGVFKIPGKGWVVFRTVISGDRVISHEIVSDPEPKPFAATRLRAVCAQLLQEAEDK